MLDVFAPPSLKIFRLTPEAILPKFATENSACFDLHACLCENDVVKFKAGFGSTNTSLIINSDRTLKVFPGYRILVPTGLVVDIPIKHSLRLHPRSGLAWNNGITLANAEGVVDSDYVEQVFALIHNTSGDVFDISHGDRICQAELILDLRYDIVETNQRPAPKTSRNGGFGSTGK